MAIAHVAAATKVEVSASSSTTPSITLAGTSVGNTLIAFFTCYDANTTWTISSVADGANTYTTRQAVATLASDRSRAAVSHSISIGTGGSRTVTFTLGSTSAGANRYYTTGLVEKSDVGSEDTFSTNSDIVTSGGTDVTAGAITTTDAGDLIAGVAAVHTATDTALNFSSPTSWTNRYRTNDGVNTMAHDSGDWIPGSIQTGYNPAWSHDNNANDEGCAVVVAFKPNAGGVAPAPNVSDSITVSESVSLKIPLLPRPFDSVTVAESVTMNVKNMPNVFDAVTVAEALTMNLLVMPNVNDAVTVSESATAFFPFLCVQANETVTVTESVTVSIASVGILSISTFDEIAVAENAAVMVLLMPSVSDEVTVAEALVMNVLLMPVVFDEVTVAESIVVSNPVLPVSVFDAITVAEARTVQVGDVTVTPKRFVIDHWYRSYLG